MKKNLFNLSIILSLSTISYAQVGINTETPKTTMDVSAKRDTSGTILDNTQTLGLQAPRITRAELTANSAIYSDDQKGALVYITDITGGNAANSRSNITTIGYYYFDGAVWQKILNQNIYTNDGTIADPFRIVRMYRSGVGTSKLGFNASSLANYTATNKSRVPTFSFIGGEANHMLLRNGTTLPTADYKFEGSGTFMTSSMTDNLDKYSYLLSNQITNSNNLWQMIAGKSANPVLGAGNGLNQLYIGGISTSKLLSNAASISFVVDSDRDQTNYAFDNSTTPMVIDGTGTEIDATTFRSTVTIQNTDLYLTDLENTTSTEAAGQVLTLIQNPLNLTKLKAVWRDATFVSKEPWNQANSVTSTVLNPLEATSNTQQIYQNAYVGIGDFQKTIPSAAFHVLGKSPTGGLEYSQDNIIAEGQSNTDNDPVLILRRSRYNQATNALEKVNAGDYAGTIQFQAYDGNKYQSNKTGLRGLVKDANSNVDIVFFNDTTTSGNTSVVERMRITSAGNIGIGTTTPAQLLDVNGIIKGNGLTNGNAVYSNTNFGLYNQENKFTRITSTNETNSAVAIYTDATATNNYTGSLATLIARNNKVGIGTEAPTAMLHIKKQSEVPTLRLENLESLESGNTNALVIDANGYVKKASSLMSRSASDITQLENKVQTLEEKIKLLEEKIDALTNSK